MPDQITDIGRTALALAAALAGSSPGGKSQTRRMTESGAPLFWRQVARLDIPPFEEGHWMTFTKLIALTTPASRSTSIHDKDQPFGSALARAGYSETRLARLLATRGPARAVALERAVRVLAAKPGGFDVTDLAHLIFRPTETRRLVRSYYQTLDHLKSDTPQEVTQDE